ncbi:hypothetical protein ACQY0O_005266 [Thecaphora frezii]
MASFGSSSEERELKNKIDIETKIKDGAENLLHVFDLRLASSAKHDLRKQIESELHTANAKIAALHQELQRLRATSPPLANGHHAQAAHRWPRETDQDPVSRLEASALGLEHHTLFLNAAGPSRLPDLATNYQVSRMQDAFDTGSPPSTNLANEIGASRSMEGLMGGLGIGIDGGLDHPIDSGRTLSRTGFLVGAKGKGMAASLANDSERERDRESEDAQAMRSLATALIRSLRSVPSRIRSGSAPLLMSGSGLMDESGSSSSKTAADGGGGSQAAASTAAVAAMHSANMPLPIGAPSRVNRRQITRNRVAALANSRPAGHVRTPSNASGLGDAAKRQIDTMNRLVNVLKKHARVRYELLLDDLVEVVMPCLADTAGKEVRAAAYRLLRHALIHPPWPLISRCRSKGLDIYLTRSMIRDNRFDAEREQALKLVRAIMELSALRTVSSAPDRLAPDLQDLIGPGVVRAMAAIAEDSEDKLRHICLETLAELAVFDVRLLIKGGGLRSTLQALVDSPNDFAPALVQTFLYLIDMPGTRNFLRPGVDLEVALSGLTENVPLKPVAYEARLNSTAKVVSTMLRSWGGLLYMCMDGKRAVKSIVVALRVNAVEVKDTILDLLYDLFNVRAAAQLVDPASKRQSSQRLDADSASQPATSGTDGKHISTPNPNSGDGDAQASSEGQAAQRRLLSLGEMADQPRSRLNLVDHYLALLLVVFIESGLVEALVDVIEHTPEMRRKATLLMGELLQVSKRVHPPTIGSSIHSLPHLFALAASFKPSKSVERQTATLALSSIDRVNQQRVHYEASVGGASTNGAKPPATRDRSNSVDESVRRGQRQVEKTKIRLGMQIDDNQFRNLMVDTQILNTKDHAKWNLDMLTDMLEGPLLNPRRMDEVVRGTKFLKRLLAFFHPFSLRFSSIRKIGSNRRFVKLGCLLLSTLVCTAEGVKALVEDRLLREIRECFEQLDPMSGTPISDPLMSKSRLEETLTSGYFEMLGVLTQSAEGIRLLERHKIFTPLYHLSELRSRDDIIEAVIENFDYSFDGHTRVVLSKALSSSYRHMRLFATRHLAELIRCLILTGNAARPPAAEDDGGEWMISLLLSQLYDPSIEVRELAVKVLEESCASIEVLEKVVAMRPTLDHLGDIGHPLLLKFLSTSVGFRYLWHGDYIDREMDHWFNERNHRYAIQVEVMLANFFSIYRTSAPNRKDASAEASSSNVDADADGTVPPHFYGELAKTAEGCEILRQRGHFGEFAHFIRQHGMEHSDAELINKLKSVLWAVVSREWDRRGLDVAPPNTMQRGLTSMDASSAQGNIGSTVLGLPFLEAEDVISQIVEIAENSPVMSVRGTCFFVLGLISATTQGAEVLQDYGWMSVSTPLGVPMGLCIPNDIDRLVSMPRWEVQTVVDLGYLDFPDPETVLENKVVTAIANLGNSILANNASRMLAKLKHKHKEAFADIALLTRAIELTDNFYIRLPVRRYIWELFDITLNEEVVERLQTHRALLVEAGRGARRNGRSKAVRPGTADDGQQRVAFSGVDKARHDPTMPAAVTSTVRAVPGMAHSIRHPGLRGIAELESDDGAEIDSELDDGDEADLSVSVNDYAEKRADIDVHPRVPTNGATGPTHAADKLAGATEAGVGNRARLLLAGTVQSRIADTTQSGATHSGTVRGLDGRESPEPPKLAIAPRKKVLGFAVS